MGERFSTNIIDFYNRDQAAEREIGSVITSRLSQGFGGPTSGLIEGANQVFHQDTSDGAVYWTFGLGAFFVESHVLSLYRQLGAEVSTLGSPTAHSAIAQDGAGASSTFEHGAIYWHPAGGAFDVRGAIAQKYWDVGAEHSFLGYPTSAQRSCADGIGQFVDFQFGSIYWTPELGAVETHGLISGHWKTMGAESSYLGYPVSDEQDWVEPDNSGSGRFSRFQRGIIVFLRSPDTVTDRPDTVVFESGWIETDSVRGWVELTMNSTGSYAYKGHMHNGGFLGLHFAVSTIPEFQAPDGSVLIAAKEGHVGGTSSSDDRNEDWAEAGRFEPRIRQHWDAIRTSGVRTKLEVNTTVGDVIETVLFSIPFALAAIAAVLLLSGDAKTCPPKGSVYRDPMTGEEHKQVSIEVVGRDDVCH